MNAIKIQPMREKDFAPFGDLIDFDRAYDYQINNGNCDRYDALATPEAMAGQAERVVECDVALDQDVVRIMVRDHGPGVPSDVLEQVFDAFFTTKEAGSGMGLGMSISQNIVTDFGGALSVKNHRDGGAVFTVTLNRPDERSAESAGT